MANSKLRIRGAITPRQRYVNAKKASTVATTQNSKTSSISQRVMMAEEKAKSISTPVIRTKITPNDFLV